MAKKASEVDGPKNSCLSDNEEELVNITYQNSSADSTKNFSVEDVSKSFDNLTIEKNVSYESKTGCMESENVAEDEEKNYVGLVNQAMTCYLNSLLQALYMTPEFRNALYKWEYKCSESDKDNLSTPLELQKLFLNLQLSEKSSVETNSLTESLGWDGSEAWQQHDIPEFCRVVFDALEKSFQDTDQADLISRLYEGKISDYVKCLSCNTVKSREDTFLNIPLPVRLYDTNERCSSVEQALKEFVKCETLEGNDQYFCEKCNKKTNAHKELKFLKVPYILTLQLKRFEFDQNTNCRKKLNDKVTFPKILNIKSFIESKCNRESANLEVNVGSSVTCDDTSNTDNSMDSTEDEGCVLANNVITSNHSDFINHDQLDDEGIVINNETSSWSSFDQNQEELQGQYELFCILIHSGNARSGHYYAHIKDFRTNKWLCFNDERITSISNEDIQKTFGGSYSKSNAYMLMYRQIDLNCNCLPMEAEDFPAHIQYLVKKMKNKDDTKRVHFEDTRDERSELEETSNSDKEKTRNKKKTKKEQIRDEKVLRRLKKKNSGSSVVSRLPKRLRISDSNPKPLRRSAYQLRSHLQDYYSFDSNEDLSVT